ncbi:MAG: hypothetical protein J6J23_01725 [Clostridia bacterium]|nr:hypothetical protein [Clostridia bacterium]
MEKFKGYDVDGLMRASEFSTRNLKGESAVRSIAGYLSKEGAYERHKKLCLQKVLRESGLQLSEEEAKIVMECFTTDDYTRANILLTKEAYKRLSVLGKEGDIEEFKKFFLDYKEYLRHKNAPDPLDVVMSEFENILSFVDEKPLDIDMGIAVTLSKIRSGKTRYAQMVVDELCGDIKYLEDNCESIINLADFDDYVAVYHMLNNVIYELEGYKELIDEEFGNGSQRLENKAVEQVLLSLNKINENYRQVTEKCESELDEESNAEENDNDTQRVDELTRKFKQQWHTYLVHYQDILVHYSSDYVVRSNPYAKRLMSALEQTDKELKKLTGKSLLQIKLLEVEDKYRPIVGHGGVKTPRVPVQSGEDE